MTLLKSDNAPFAEILKKQVDLLDRQLVRQTRLLMRLQHLSEYVAAGKRDPDELLAIMQIMNRSDDYFDSDELALLDQRRLEIGGSRLAEIRQAWAVLVREIQLAMEQGIPAQSPIIEPLARRWLALTKEFTGNDHGLMRKLSTMYENETGMQQQTGITAAMLHYITTALSLFPEHQTPGVSP